ncbi:hypothetical protein J6590_079440 [Homalodisca vitripennis]|nr:hypothetical protein J6590_079440 [Homalodisca vitripennis]
MESKGILDMFQQSESTYDIRYKYFLGDGDSSAYPTVVQAKPYGEDFNIEKLELCVSYELCPKGTYNEGNSVRCQVLDRFGIRPGANCANRMKRIDELIINQTKRFKKLKKVPPKEFNAEKETRRPLSRIGIEGHEAVPQHTIISQVNNCQGPVYKIVKQYRNTRLYPRTGVQDREAVPQHTIISQVINCQGPGYKIVKQYRSTRLYPR